MNLSPATLAFLLLVATFVPATACPRVETKKTQVGPICGSVCCGKYAKKPIPRNLVKNYFHTSSNCPLPSVVFISKKGRSICADPSEQWVRDLMRYIYKYETH